MQRNIDNKEQANMANSSKNVKNGEDTSIKRRYMYTPQ